MTIDSIMSVVEMFPRQLTSIRTLYESGGLMRVYSKSRLKGSLRGVSPLPRNRFRTGIGTSRQLDAWKVEVGGRRNEDLQPWQARTTDATKSHEGRVQHLMKVYRALDPSLITVRCLKIRLLLG